MKALSGGGMKGHLLRKWFSGLQVSLQSGQDFLDRNSWAHRFGILLPKHRFWDISGLMDARVHDRNSVPYLCFASFGKWLCIRWRQVRTMKFSIVGESSSSSSMASPRWVTRSKLSSTIVSGDNPQCTQTSHTGIEHCVLGVHISSFWNIFGNRSSPTFVSFTMASP